MKRHALAGAVTLQIEGDLPSLGGATEWINSAPLTAAGLRGKVVLIDFWTYTCINWLRTLPYVRAWAEKYRDQGLVVIGVHSPEFEFEKDIGNVRRAAKDMRVDYPIAVDSEHAVWRAFRNQYWPALYFVDAQGRIRHHQFGEGEYEKAEMVIQQLLAEAGARGVGRDLVTVEARGLEVAADWSSLKSPENYVGYDRTENFASPGGAVLGQRRNYAVPSRLSLNQWALSGEWTVGRQAILLGKASGRVAYRFHARDLHLVMGPAAGAQPVRFRVLIDGQPPGACARSRRRRPGQRHSERAEVVSADPPTEAHRRSTVRDRVPRSGRGGVRVHVRLRCGPHERKRRCAAYRHAPDRTSTESGVAALPRQRPVSARRRHHACSWRRRIRPRWILCQAVTVSSRVGESPLPAG